MADISANQVAASTRNPLVAFGEAILNTLVRIGEQNARVKEVERLSALSDAQLAQRGLRREDIVQHVFRDMYFV